MTCVAIVGAGIAGLSTAWALTKRGIAVILYEQASAIPNPLSASGDEHRIIRRAYGHQSGYANRIDAAYEAWESMFEDLGANHLVSNGFLLISQTPDDEAERYRDGLIAGGYPLEILSDKEAAERFKFLEPGTFRYAGFGPEGGALMCQRIAKDLTSWLEHNGAELKTGARISRINADTGELSFANGKTAKHERIIVTAGAWALELWPELARTLTTFRTAVCYLSPPGHLKTAWENAPVILDAGGQSDGYAIPPLMGSGLKLGTGQHKFRSKPDKNRQPGEEEHLAIREWFSPPLKDLGAYAHEKTVTCAYTFTRDEHFYTHTQGKMTIVSACSGHGYKFGAAIGQHVADAVQTGNIDALKEWLAARD
ncbi:MAG: FAD-dependent oxidoreductase [Pseudomonadota bacterium]